MKNAHVLEEIDPIKKFYSTNLEKETREQILEIVKNETKYAFFKAIYNLDQENTIEQIYIESKKYIETNPIDLVDFYETISFFKQNNLSDFQYHSPVRIQINEKGKELFYQVFDIIEFMFKPIFNKLSKDHPDEKDILRRNLISTIEYVLV